MSVRIIQIDYHRPPDRLDQFRQSLIEETAGYSVTLLDPTRLKKAVTVDQIPILEPGSAVVWFTYPGRWHDVGLFHLSDGSFSGVYANILTPVRMREDHWSTTDLFLDVWWTPRDGARVLDGDELAEALRLGWVTPEQARCAGAEAAWILDRETEGLWPPAETRTWSLERARQCLHDLACED